RLAPQPCVGPLTARRTRPPHGPTIGQITPPPALVQRAVVVVPVIPAMVKELARAALVPQPPSRRRLTRCQVPSHALRRLVHRHVKRALERNLPRNPTFQHHEPKGRPAAEVLLDQHELYSQLEQVRPIQPCRPRLVFHWYVRPLG